MRDLLTRRHLGRVTGVACLVRDSKFRSYFIRVVNVDEKTVCFEQEIYRQFKNTYTLHEEWLHIFAGAKSMVGLSFSAVEDSQEFRRRTHRVAERQSRSKGKSKKKAAGAPGRPGTGSFRPPSAPVGRAPVTSRAPPVGSCCRTDPRRRRAAALS